MQTSRFQLGLIATLAVGLGFSLSSSEAVGYPAGAAVSMGSNPVVSTGGSLMGSDSASAFDVSADSSIIVTSVVLSAYDYWGACTGNSTVALSVPGGELARFVVGLSRPGSSNYTSYEPSVVVKLPSGIRVPAGQELTIQSYSNEYQNCEGNKMKIEYTLSGYHAQG